jgi:transposase-like protein
MGQLLHGCAKTTHAIREELQRSEASIAVLSQRYHINPKTVQKWKKRKDEGVEDRSNAPKKPYTVLTEADEACIIAFRQLTQLPLDDCYDVLAEQIPALNRSNLYRCLKRHGLSRLPEESSKRTKQPFKSYDIGYVHVDITTVHVAQKKLYIYVAICRVSKFAYAEIHEVQTADVACQFLAHLVAACPFKIHTILTDNGCQFTYTRLNLLQKTRKKHRFTAACTQYGIRHRKTKPYRPQTNGQVERFNQTIKNATTKLYHYETKEQLEHHLLAFIDYYNHGKKLSALNRKTPWEKILTCWEINPKLFQINPYHQPAKLNN